MDQSTSSEFTRVTILSNIVLFPHLRTSHATNSTETEVINITNEDIDESSSESQCLKNLSFELPTKDGFSKKRKQEFLQCEQIGEKRTKIEQEIKEDDTENSEDDEEEKVFNYMTGTYEPVRKTDKLRPREHIQSKNEPEDISVDVTGLVQEEKIIVSTTEDRPHLVGSSISSGNIILPSASEGLEIRLLHKDISLLDTTSPPPNRTILSPNPPKLIISSDHSCLDDDSNNSVHSVHLPAGNLSCNDESSNDTIVITTPETNSTLENNNSSTGMLKNLLIHVNSHPKSSSILSDSNAWTNTDKDNINLEHSYSGIEVKSEAVTKGEKSFVNELRGKLSLLNWACKTCGFVADSKNNLILHIYNAHLKDDYEMRIKCKNCDFECDTLIEMKLHELNHKIIVSDKDNLFSSVSSCETSALTVGFPSQNNDLTKTITRNRRKPKRIVDINNSDDDEYLPSRKHHVQCFFCKYRTDMVKYLKLHVRKHARKKYYCDEHFWSDAGTFLTCSKCVFEDIMLDLRKKTCKICGHIAMSEKDLKIHCDSPFLCEQYGNTNKKRKIDTRVNQSEHTSVYNQNSIQLGQSVTSHTAQIPQNLPEPVELPHHTGAPLVDRAGTVREGTDSSQKRKSPDGSEGVIIDLDDSSEEEVSFKCFDCDKTFINKDGLKTHALSCHPASCFRCDVHKSKINFHECEKCVYELIFRNCRSKRLVVEDEDPFDASEIAHFDTDSDRDVSSNFEQRAIRITRARTAKSRQSIQDQQKERLQDAQNGDDESDDSGSTTGLSNNTSDKTKRHVKCYDCNCYKAYGSYKVHVSRHVGSKFQCTDHWKSANKDCPKCQYELMLQNLKNEVLTCKTCGLNTPDQYNFNRHENRSSKCEKFKLQRQLLPNEMLCFECQYATKHKDFLKHHMVDHLDQEFSCKKHIEEKDSLCLECIHEECLKNAKKEVSICQKCGFKAVDKVIFTLHGCEQRSVGNSNELRDLERQDSNGITLAENSESKVNTYTANNVPLTQVNTPENNSAEKNPASTNAENNASEGTELSSIERALESLAEKNITENSVNEIEDSNVENNKHPSVINNINDKSAGPDNETVECALVSLVEKNLSEKNPAATNVDNETTVANTETIEYAQGTLVEKNCSEGNPAETSSTVSDEALSNAIIANNEGRENYINNCKTNEVIGTTQSKKEIISSTDNTTSSNQNKVEISATEVDKDMNGKKQTDSDLREAKCFDCKFSCNIELKDLSFLRHINRHIGSKYQCIKHQKVKLKSCQKCHYEEKLKDACRIVKSCKTCGYRTVDNFAFKRHLDSTDSCKKWMNRVTNQSEIRCSVCHYMTTHKKFLEYHMVDHLHLTLSCNEHHEKDGTCNMCINKICLDNAKKEVKICEKCNFKTVIRQVFETHDCIGKEEDPQVDNPRTEDASGKSILDNTDNNVNSDTDNDAADNDEIPQTETINDSNVKPQMNAKCFDCKYSSSDNDIAFKEHVCRHVGSKYQCVEHWKSKIIDCPKCYYEKVLQMLQTEVKTCTVCGYKARDELGLARHLEEPDSCSKWSNQSLEPREIRCFECQYVTIHRTFLKYHMVDHLNVNFSCDLHQEKKDKECNKCIYEVCLESAKMEAKICEKCNFKTVVKKIFDLHGCEKNDREEITKGTNENIGSIEAVSKNNTTLKVENVNSTNDCSEKVQKAQCFDCDFTTADNYSLLKHICRHIGSKFQCIQHPEVKLKLSDCQKCHYETSLKKVSDRIRICNTCGYATIDLNRFNRHKSRNSCKKWQSILHPGEVKCLKCQYVTKIKKFLKYHMVDHLDETLSCSVHRKKEVEKCQTCLNVSCLESAKKEVKICEKCNFKTVIKQVFDMHSCKPIEDNTEEKPDTETKNKCFDCRYTSSDNDISFKEHACRHIGSKYQCMEHLKSKEKNCPKCHYEKVLKILQKVAETCQICGYKAIDKASLKKHLEKFGSCSNWANRSLGPEELRCLECQYITIHKKFLKYHMVNHLEVNISCEVHQGNKSDTCEKCINEDCLANAKNEVKPCNKCDFKTVIKQIFDIHVCEVFNNTDGTGCDSTETGAHSVEKNGESSSQITKSNDQSNNTRKIGDIEDSSSKKNSLVRCFDCSYSCLRKKYFRFRKHVCRHLGTKYRCMEHLNFKFSDCLKCNYEVTVSELRDILNCSTCGFKTVDKNTMTRHKNGKDSCSRWVNNTPKAGVLKCYECHYMTTHEKFLKYHMVDHLDIEFACEQHAENKDEECPKCVCEKSLKSAKKEVKICEKCNFKTAIKKLFDIHKCNRSNGENAEQNTSQKYTCFDCDKTLFAMYELWDHAVSHPDSNFQCDEHIQDLGENCSKCIYQDVVRTVQKGGNFIKIAKVESLNEPEEKQDEEEATGLLACFHCEFKSNKSSLKSHAVKHYGQPFKCDYHNVAREEGCRKCIYENILKNNETSLNICEKCQYKTLNKFSFDNHLKNNACSAVQTKAEVQTFFKCFDCGATYHTEYGLKSHAIRHKDSPFQCDDHRDNVDMTCQKCIYEDIVKNIENSSFTCDTCGYKTYSLSSLKRHKDNKANCELHKAKLLAEGKNVKKSQDKKHVYKCFDCDFSDERKFFLVKHALDHKASQFQCDEHKKSYFEGCMKCLYQEILDKNFKRSRCLECTPNVTFTSTYNLRRHIFNSHKDSYYICMTHSIKSGDCPNCFYESMVKNAHQRFYDLVCGDCKKRFRVIKDMKIHIKEMHLQSTFVCSIHQLQREPNNCSMCAYETLIPLCQNEDVLGQADPATSKLPKLRYQCFDCEFLFTGKGFLIDHINKNHFDSNFSCSEHRLGDIDATTCAMCRYETVLVSCKQDTSLNCSKCNFKAPNDNALTEHRKEKHSKGDDSIQQGHSNVTVVGESSFLKKPDKFPCFDCDDFVTNSEKKLLMHMSKPSHGKYRIKFLCKFHAAHNDNCDRCIFAKLKVKARENRKKLKRAK